MTKSLFMFSTKIWMYLSEIPPIGIFILCAFYNKHSTLAGGLIPLMVLMVVLAIFFFVFLFRAVKLTPDQIKKIGRFTDKDSVVLKKDMTLSLTLLKRGRVKIEVFGTNDSTPVYPWLKNSPTHEIRHFAAKVTGRRRRVKQILSFFSAPRDTYDALLSNEICSFETATLLLSAENSENGRKINIKFLKTL